MRGGLLFLWIVAAAMIACGIAGADQVPLDRAPEDEAEPWRIVFLPTDWQADPVCLWLGHTLRDDPRFHEPGIKRKYYFPDHRTYRDYERIHKHELPAVVYVGKRADGKGILYSVLRRPGLVRQSADELFAGCRWRRRSDTDQATPDTTPDAAKVPAEALAKIRQQAEQIAALRAELGQAGQALASARAALDARSQAADQAEPATRPKIDPAALAGIAAAALVIGALVAGVVGLVKYQQLAAV